MLAGIVCTFYSTIGGMKAVLMTDLFQAILMFVAVFCVIIYEAIDKGSLAEIWRIAEQGNRTDLFKYVRCAKVVPKNLKMFLVLIQIQQ